jgi:hypothetical protein
MDVPFSTLRQSLKALGYQPVSQEPDGRQVWVLWPERVGLASAVPPLRLVLAIGGTHLAALYRVTADYVSRYRDAVLPVDRETRTALTAELVFDATTSAVVRRQVSHVRGEQLWLALCLGAWCVPWWTEPESTFWGPAGKRNIDVGLAQIQKMLPEFAAYPLEEFGLEREAERATDPLSDLTWNQLEAKAAELKISGRRSLNKQELAMAIRDAGGDLRELVDDDDEENDEGGDPDEGEELGEPI